MFSSPIPKLHWCKEVWSRLNTPKHSLILWLVMLDKLKTKDRLLKMGIKLQETCNLCTECNETIQHLFFECRITNQCLIEIKSWLKWNVATFNIRQLVKWIGRAKVSKFKKAVYSAAIAAMVYNAWKMRNAVLWQGVKIDNTRLIEEVKWSLRTRVQSFLPKKLSSVDREWFCAL
uniref:Reverse transcriptase zinc-binding domain-containing protein n=1 Tax=Cannabis sativa TaxID=3483 RepID=A0A803NL60_CANSA